MVLSKLNFIYHPIRNHRKKIICSKNIAHSKIRFNSLSITNQNLSKRHSIKIIFSILKESAVRKAEPTLFILLILSKTNTNGTLLWL